jgi:hypothetical protein
MRDIHLYIEDIDKNLIKELLLQAGEIIIDEDENYILLIFNEHDNMADEMM